ncbi:PREDICTED: apoptosis regulator BAX-like [Condylura cristata]|uniref:apoptosis regulator BAX-like n=1 Tax=Condylura cristata TaxID=143302 RepID=UPI000642DC3C|nr:PREDICTED: apoptosis regulator BAX-like [Condylura cristata]
MDQAMARRTGGGLIIPEQIMRTGACLLQNFILDQVRQAGGPVFEMSQDAGIKMLVQILKNITQDLDNNKEMQRLIVSVKDKVCTVAVFFQVANQLISEGITWSRVAALFYFASKLVLQALHSGMPEQIASIMHWTLDFLRERLLEWIQEQGGWDGLVNKYNDKFKWLTVAMTIGTCAFFLIRRLANLG